MTITIQLAEPGINWFDSAVTFMAVILGAVLAYGAATASERRKARIERRARAILLMLKLQNVVNGILTIDRQLRLGIKRAEEAGCEGPAWTKMEAMASIGDYEVEIEPSDLAVLAEGHHYVMIQEIAELESGHNGVVRALSDLFHMKDEVGRELRPQMEGRVATFQGDLNAIAPHLGPAIANLETLGDDILENLDELVPKARRVAGDFGSTIRKDLKDRSFPLMVVDPPSEGATGAARET